MTNNEIFRRHLYNALKEINSEYEYKIEWYVDIQKKIVNGGNLDLGKKEIFIVLTPLPSKSFGNGSIVQQLEIEIMCEQSVVSDVLDILTTYQSASINKRYFDDTTMISETWMSPTIQETNVTYQVTKGMLITMTGSVSFSQDVVDIDKVYIFDQENKMFQYMPSTTADSLPNSSINDNGMKKVKNRGLLSKTSLKCKNTNSIFCQTCRLWKNGQVKANVTIPVRVIYTDGYEEVNNMVITSLVYSFADGGIPTISVELMLKME